jgi:hypothetical protein
MGCAGCAEGAEDGMRPRGAEDGIWEMGTKPLKVDPGDP